MESFTYYTEYEQCIPKAIICYNGLNNKYAKSMPRNAIIYAIHISISAASVLPPSDKYLFYKRDYLVCVILKLSIFSLRLPNPHIYRSKYF